jgi:hypothetical protein
MTTTGALFIDGEKIEYTLNTQPGFAKETLVIAECVYRGGRIVGEPRKSQRAAEASLKRAIARHIATDQAIAAERKRLAAWNAGHPKSFGE